MIDIKFNRIVHFTGRNGHFKCGGITVIDNNNDITFMPLTSKGVNGNAAIDIPKEHVNDLIKSLLIFSGDLYLMELKEWIEYKLSEIDYGTNNV